MPYYDDKNYTPEQRATYETLAVLENSARHAANVEAAQKAHEARLKKDEENEKLLAKFDAEREAELKAETEEKRKQAAAYFEQSLRDQFFAGNSHVTESDFQSVLPDLRKSAMLKNMENVETAESVIRNSGSYSRM
jgi:membrane protein involved in colicin uptake